jgi:dihydrofolate reductase
MLSIIAVIGKNRELGKDNDLIWHLPADLKRFRDITRGHPVIMGRKTFESIGRPLPNRTNIIISSHSPNALNTLNSPNCFFVSSLDDAIRNAQLSPGSEEIFVIGGGSVYAQAIDKVDSLYLTVVDAVAAQADTFFPDYSRFTKVIEESAHEENGIHYTYRTLEK